MPSTIIDLVSKTPLDPSWSFKGIGRKETTYLTHGYHRYPAKFIPQIVSRVLHQYTQPNDLVIDPFGGCGTTLVEAKVKARRSLAVDINPIATLISKVKVTPLAPPALLDPLAYIEKACATYEQQDPIPLPSHPRMSFWFREATQKKLAFLLNTIQRIDHQDIQDFLYCAFSHILKNCSIWLQSSNKPTRDFTKKEVDPFTLFPKQVRHMMRGNTAFYETLTEKGLHNVPSEAYCRDARNIPVQDEQAQLVMTSPPYVTSYEYADLHQLSNLWLHDMQDLSQFRQRFIGTSYHSPKTLPLHSTIAEQVTQKLSDTSQKTATSVATYFGEMYQVFQEMQRVLKKGGRACIVIGDTTFKNVKIHNTAIFIEQLSHVGFHLDTLIKREIPSKNIPSTRDPKTGRFTPASNAKKTYIYPTEHILIMQKP